MHCVIRRVRTVGSHCISSVSWRGVKSVHSLHNILWRVYNAFTVYIIYFWGWTIPTQCAPPILSGTYNQFTAITADSVGYILSVQTVHRIYLEGGVKFVHSLSVHSVHRVYVEGGVKSVHSVHNIFWRMYMLRTQCTKYIWRVNNPHTVFTAYSAGCLQPVYSTHCLFCRVLTIGLQYTRHIP